MNGFAGAVVAGVVGVAVIARELRNLINEFGSKIDVCIEKIKKIKLKGKLRGKCEYC
jgi:hypothetical protein